MDRVCGYWWQMDTEIHNNDCRVPLESRRIVREGVVIGDGAEGNNAKGRLKME
jgi:hypothetical protein